MADPLAIAGGVANVTAVLPILQDSLIYAANFLVTNTVGALALGMVTIAFGFGLISRLVKGRRGRR